ncbi:MAG: DMT family transporter [Candidatus Promineifilaceae bacterium]|jgi:drug/metabolite transporter (DMT)-like permease
MSEQSKVPFPTLVAALLVADSMHFIFGRSLAPYLPPTAASFYYMTLALIQIAIFAALRREINFSVLRDNLHFFASIGFLIAVATSASYAAILYIDPGTAALLAQTGIFFSMGFGLFWLKERMTGAEQRGAALAIIGVMIISFQPGFGSSGFGLGALLVLTSTFTYALHAAIVKREGGGIDFINFFLFRMASSCFFLFLFTIGRGELVWPSGPEVWLILLLAATVNVTISRALYYIVLRRINLTILTILLTLSPVLTIIWSILLFNERPSLQGLIGGTAVILGVIVVTLSKRK